MCKNELLGYVIGKLMHTGFMISENKPTLYLKKEGKNDSFIVDDTVYTISSNSLVAEFKTHMMNEFEI